jgi:hypothetical protein
MQTPATISKRRHLGHSLGAMLIFVERGTAIVQNWAESFNARQGPFTGNAALFDELAVLCEEFDAGKELDNTVRMRRRWQLNCF